jgi:HEAT repeat protein
MRALAAMGDMPSRRVLERVVAESETDSTLRLEAANALAGLHAPESLDFIIDLMSDPAPSIRGAAIRALAAIDSETFLTTLSGMDPDRDWTVRTAQADALALLPGRKGRRAWSRCCRIAISASFRQCCARSLPRNRPTPSAF